MTGKDFIIKEVYKYITFRYTIDPHLDLLELYEAILTSFPILNQSPNDSKRALDKIIKQIPASKVLDLKEAAEKLNNEEAGRIIEEGVRTYTIYKN